MDLTPLFETILAEIHAPEYDENEPFQMLVSDLGYSEFLGRLAIGKVFHGRAASGERLVCVADGGVQKTLRVTRLQAYDGIRLGDAASAEPGDIVVLSGIEDVHIGDTITVAEGGKALPRITVA